MAMKLYTESSVQNIADAIRLKNGLSSKYAVSQMAQAVRDIPLGEDISQYRAILNGTISGSFTCDISSVGTYAFGQCTNLTSINFPQCIAIGSYAFVNCSSLTSISFPQCAGIGTYAFANCSSLTSISFPRCIIIGSSAFRICLKLSKITIGTGISSAGALMSPNAFYSTPISRSSYLGYFGSIYVPSSLLTQYQTATN